MLIPIFDGDQSLTTDLTSDGTLAPPVLQPPPQPQAQEFAVDSSGLLTVYANFARVTGTPEELVLDFGLNTQM